MTKTKIINDLKFIREQLYGSKFSSKAESITEAIKIIERFDDERDTIQR